jgi:GT2 family glycosyltransferase
MDDVAVIIVNWNALDDLRRCLQSLSTWPSRSTVGVWVVDNNSSDGSAAMVEAEFPDVHLIANTHNFGFSHANNQGIRESDSRFVFLLNSDAMVHSGTIDNLVAYAEEHDRAAVIGPKVLNRDGSLQFSCRRFPSLGAGFFRNTLLGRLFPNNKYARAYLMTDIDHDQVRTVDWLSGCAMFIPRRVIGWLGPLDERFFMYCEDVDICKRAWDASLQVVYVPQAVVTHAIGRSSDKSPERMIIEFHRSWYEYDLKHRPRGGPLRRAAVYSGLWLRAAMRIARRRLAERRVARPQPVATPPPQRVTSAIDQGDRAAP